MLFSSKFFFLLAVHAAYASVPTNHPRCPEPGVLFEKLANLSAALQSIDEGLERAENIIDEQCPCIDNSTDCFEVRFENFRVEFSALREDVQNVSSIAPEECPDRTGAIFVATCDGTDVLNVDPNGILQNGFSTDENVTRWSVFASQQTYGYEYFVNDPLRVRCRANPEMDEILLGSASNSPLTSDAVGTGVSYNPATDQDLVAITFDNETLNGIYAFNRTSPVSISLYRSFNERPTGLLEVAVDGNVYISSGGDIYRLGSGDTETLAVSWSVDVTAFTVQANGNIVFCDTSGGVMRWQDGTPRPTFIQLRRPVRERFCRSVIVNPCDSLIYVGDRDEPDLEIYNATTYTFVDTLTYTSSDPSACPSIAADPSFCCA